MSPQQNTFYLAYCQDAVRRLPLELANAMRHHGFEVFLETSYIKQFESPPKRILEQIESHSHFLLLLTPASFGLGFNPPRSHLKDEIKHALQTERTFVVILAYGLQSNPLLNCWWVSSLLPDDFIQVTMPDTNSEALIDNLAALLQMDNQVVSRPETSSNVQLDAEYLLDQGLSEQYNAECDNYRSKAVNYYNKSLELDPLYAEAYYQRAEYYSLWLFTKWQELTPSEVLAEYDHAIRLSPDQAKYYERQAHLHERMGKKQAALHDFTSAIQQAPHDSTHYRDRASLYFKLDNLDAARDDYDRAIQLKPNEARYYLDRSMFHKHRKDYALAVADINSAITLAPRDEYYLYRGFMHVEMQEFENAEADFKEAFRVTEDLSHTHARLASFYNYRGEYDKVLKAADEALRIDASNRLAKGIREKLVGLAQGSGK